MSFNAKEVKNKTGNTVVTVRGRMEIYVAKSSKKGYNVIYLCY